MRIILMSSTLVTLGLVCSFSAPQIGGTEEVQATAATETPALEVDAIDPSSTPELGQDEPTATSQPTATETPLPTPTELPYKIYDILTMHEERESIPGGKNYYFMGVAQNNSPETLDTVRVGMDVYDQGELILSDDITQGHTWPVMPGEKITFFGRGFIPTSKEGGEIRVTVYSEPFESENVITPYREFEIVDVKKTQQPNGTRLDVSIKNTGDVKSYPYLHFAFYDENGELFDANFIGAGDDGIAPGQVAVQDLYSFGANIADYELYIVGIESTE